MEDKNREQDNHHPYTRSIELLNMALDNEIATTLQYVYFHIHLDDARYRELSEMFEKIAIREMVHCEKLAKRILYLEGEFDMNTSFKAKQVTSVEEMLSLAEYLEEQTINNYNAYVRESAELKDGITHTLFEELLADEESHHDSFRQEKHHLKLFGDKYLMLQAQSYLKEEVENMPSEE